jgi:hypothetical protein
MALTHQYMNNNIYIPMFNIIVRSVIKFLCNID